jgi:hypothetical protein
MPEMPPSPIPSQLEPLLRAWKVVDMPTLLAAAGGRSQRSLFRDLKKLGYVSSFTHSGRYYTLRDIPRFDAFGLWFHGEVGFSRFGTLKATVAELVRGAPAGRTHGELRPLLRVRSQNTLLALVQGEEIRREAIEGMGEFVYLSPNTAVATGQLAERQRILAARKPLPASTEIVVAILAEALRAGRVVVAPEKVAQGLAVRGMAVKIETVELVLAHYDLLGGKKNGSHPRRRSPP